MKEKQQIQGNIQPIISFTAVWKLLRAKTYSTYLPICNCIKGEKMSGYAKCFLSATERRMRHLVHPGFSIYDNNY